MNEIASVFLCVATGILALVGGVSCIYYTFFRRKLYIKSCLIIDADGAAEKLEYYVRRLDSGIKISKIILYSRAGSQETRAMCGILARDYPNVVYYELTNPANNAIMDVLDSLV